VHLLDHKWHLQATLTWHGEKLKRHDIKGQHAQGCLAELIELAMESLSEAERKSVHIEFGDTVLGAEAIAHAYQSPEFALKRKAAPKRRP
jgi:hypothetical protein